MIRIACMLCLFAALFTLAGTVAAAPSLSLSPAALRLSADLPAEPVKLIFIHHSTGGNWLADPNNDQPHGGLGRALMQNNYFVSATNYGWGPDGIGDRTDIPNWLEWFLGPNRDAILRALYNENEKNDSSFGTWSRMASDPGGENVIVMFKSCFPNSNLEGKPNDPPLDEPNDYEYTVANAKAVYNALLTYFETRQDKLFVVITAPPLMKSDTSRDRAANARAFNTWLVNEWLADYPYANVAVFDYFNVLTAPDNHHRWNGSEIEHVQATNNNFSAYPSGDSHPSTEGHTKATAEFVPLLNVAYNRWQAGGAIAPPPAQPVEEQPPAAQETPTPALLRPPTGSHPPVADSHTVEGFEGEFVWFADAQEQATVVACEPASGASFNGTTAMQMTYSIPAGEWGGCWRYYDGLQDWRDTTGLTLWLRAAPATNFTLIVYSGEFDAPTPFEINLTAPPEWNALVIPWNEIGRASWADAEGLQIIDPARITSLGFSLTGGKGELWVDDVAIFYGDAVFSGDAVTPAGAPTAPTSPTPAAATEQPAEPPVEPTEAPRGRSGLCASAPLALSLLGVSLVMQRRARKS